MSTVGPIVPTPLPVTPAPDNNATTTGSASANAVGSGAITSAAPLYSAVFSSNITASNLGLAPPRSFGDVEALFTQLASVLGETIDDLRQGDANARGQRRRAALESLASVFKDMDNSVEKSNLIENKLIPEKQTEIAEKTLAKSSLGPALIVLQSELSNLQDQLDEELAKTNPNSSVVDDLTQQVSSKQSEIDSNLSSSDSLQDDIDALNQDITDLNGEKDAAKTQYQTLQDTTLLVAQGLLKNVAAQNDFGADQYNESSIQFVETLDNVLLAIRDLDVSDQNIDEIRLLLGQTEDEAQAAGAATALAVFLTTLDQIKTSFLDTIQTAPVRADSLALDTQDQRIRLGI